MEKFKKELDDEIDALVEKSELSDLLAAMTNYSERNNKHFYLTLYQDGSGYIGEEVGIHSEIAFEFQNVNELFKKLNG